LLIIKKGMKNGLNIIDSIYGFLWK
jgi:hypothetical protein